MENISKINSDVMKRHGIVVVKNNPFLAILLVVISCLLFIYSSIFDDNVNLSTVLLFLAFAIGVTGVILLFMRKSIIKDGSTGEILHKRVYFFESREEDNVENAVRNGRFDILDECSSNKSTLPLMLVLYVTRSGNCAIYQLFKYVPHSYKSVMDMQFFNRNNNIKSE